jgi:hypothetical protein
MAWWESGYPAVCKTAYTGSSPVQASKTMRERIPNPNLPPPQELFTRAERIAHDPKCQEAAKGAARLGINLALGLGGVIPIIGETTNSVARLAKKADNIGRVFGVRVDWDLTPKVKWPHSLASGALHLIPLPLPFKIPTYLLIEARIQGGYDIVAIKKGLARAQRLARGEVVDRLEDLIDNPREYLYVRQYLDRSSIQHPWAATIDDLRTKYHQNTTTTSKTSS